MAKTNKKKTRHKWYDFAEPVASVEQFVAIVAKVSDQLNAQSPDDIDPWFRGMHDVSFQLTPGMHRADSHYVLEDNLIHNFRHKAAPYLDNARVESNWDWYSLMQHYGLPTRLLDWTEGSLIALYFALNNTSTDNDAAVWILDPYRLNQKVARQGLELFIASDPPVRRYLPPPYANRRLPARPIAIQPTLNSKRMTAQRSMFTLHGSRPNPIESYTELKGYLWRIRIRRTAVNRLRNELWRCGITETTIFPELAGLCKELKDFWSWQSDDVLSK